MLWVLITIVSESTQNICYVPLLVRILLASVLLIICTLSPEPMGDFRPNSHRHIILNQWVTLDQTRTDTLLGGRKELIRFRWHWPHFQDHTADFDQKKACLHPVSWTKWRILVKRNIL